MTDGGVRETSPVASHRDAGERLGGAVGDADRGVLDARREAFAVPAEIAYFNTASLSPQLHGVRAA
ncbi:MAG: hypothetical protein QOI50_698, partial [Pseudonocardiales bacterium]|nr:hypothetical protein [Pseudonocardiales bacterium]